MSSTTNNGCVRGNGSPLTTSFEALPERRQSLDAQKSENDFENSPLLEFPKDFHIKCSQPQATNKFYEEPSEDVNVTSLSAADAVTKAKITDSYKSSINALPLELIVSDSCVFDKKLDKDDSSRNSDFVKLQDLTIRENPLTKMTLSPAESFNPDGFKVNIPNDSRRKSVSLSEKPKRQFCLEKRTKLEKYLIGITTVLTLTLFIIYLAFFNKPECLGKF